jgi:hypothetical protein
MKSLKPFTHSFSYGFTIRIYCGAKELQKRTKLSKKEIIFIMECGAATAIEKRIKK